MAFLEVIDISHLMLACLLGAVVCYLALWVFGLLQEGDCTGACYQGRANCDAACLRGRSGQRGQQAPGAHRGTP